MKLAKWNLDCIPFMATARFYSVIAIGRQRVIENWNEGGIEVLNVSIILCAACITKLDFFVLRERQFSEMMAIEHSKEPSGLCCFVLDD